MVPCDPTRHGTRCATMSCRDRACHAPQHASRAMWDRATVHTVPKLIGFTLRSFDTASQMSSVPYAQYFQVGRPLRLWANGPKSRMQQCNAQRCNAQRCNAQPCSVQQCSVQQSGSMRRTLSDGVLRSVIPYGAVHGSAALPSYSVQQRSVACAVRFAAIAHHGLQRPQTQSAPSVLCRGQSNQPLPPLVS